MQLHRRNARFIYFLIDIFFISLSFSMPYLLRNNLFPHPVQGSELLKSYLLIFFLWGGILVFILNSQMLYITDRSLSILEESWKVNKSVILSSVVVAMIIYLLQIHLFSRLVFFLSTFTLLVTLSFWRIIKKIWIRKMLLDGFLTKKVLIAGTGVRAKEVIEEIKNAPYLGFEIIGLIDEHKTGNALGFNILGKAKDIEEIAKRNFIEEIIVVDSYEREGAVLLTKMAKKMNIGLRLLVDDLDLSFDKILLNYVGYIPLITYHERSLHGTEKTAKRIFDFIISLAFLFVLLPFLLIIAILIKLDSPGPVFYISERCGRNGRVFKFYKFRSMQNDSHGLKEKIRHKSDVSGPIFKIKNDPRITRIGRILRKYSIDELPQLVNVIKGEMSLVGPRPPTPDEVEKYAYWQMQRLNITPGITCLWQVRGRSELSFYKWIKLDLWYINNWSFGLDLLILLKTIPAVIKGRGAY